MSERDIADKQARARSNRCLTAEARRSLSCLLYLLAAVYAFLAWNYSHFTVDGQGLRFTPYSMNAVVGVANLWLPTVVLAVMVGLRETRLWRLRSEAITALAVVAVCSLLFAGYLGIFPTSPPELRQTISIGASQVRSYRENGFMGDGPLQIQQEFPVAPGIVWITPLFSEGENIDMKLIDRHHLFCHCTDNSSSLWRKPPDFTLRIR